LSAVAADGRFKWTCCRIKGNDYRLVMAVDFETGIAWIKWIGTHKDYDKIDVNEVEHER
jgi:mRNA interferase HigB